MDTNTAPNATMIRIATGVARDLAAGADMSDALYRAATTLGCSPQAVAHCCNEVGAWMNDPYLEYPEGWKS